MGATAGLSSSVFSEKRYTAGQASSGTRLFQQAATVRSRNKGRRHARRGFTLIEALAAAALLLVASGLVVKTVGWSVAQRRVAARRLWAQQEAANIMEHITALPYEDITDEEVSRIELSDAARQVLSEGDLAVALEDVAGPPAGRKIQINIRWRNPAGDYDAPVRLTAWVFDGGGQP